MVNRQGFRIEYVFAICVVGPAFLYLLGLVFSWPDLQRYAGYFATFSLLAIVVLAILGNLSFNKFLNDIEAKTKRVNAIIDSLIENSNFELSFIAQDKGKIKAFSESSELFIVNEQNIKEKIERADLVFLLSHSKNLETRKK